MIDLYQRQHYSLSDISKILGISDRQIGTHLRNLNITLRPRGGRNNCHSKLKVFYQGQEISLKELSQRTRISYGALRTRIFSMGLSVEEAITRPVLKRKGKT